ncbi:MAG: class B sortase [Lachnospiraceae bacterium]|nr:class B sortase [Lachnospiraceae bacterium]
MSDEELNRNEAAQAAPESAPPPARKRRKKQKTSPLVLIVILLLLLVIGYSGYRIFDKLLEYRKGQKAYNDLRNEVIQEAQAPPGTLATSEWNVPEVEPTAPPDETAGPDDPTNDPGHSRAAVGTDEMRGDITYDPGDVTKFEPQVLPFWNIDFDRLRAINPDIKGWLYGMDGIVNYPVVQGSDNEYYSHRLLDRTERFCGTLFIDFRNHLLEDDVTYIFGHKMKDGSMFGHFGRYDTYAYYRTHPAFRLFLPDDIIYDLQVIACVYTTDRESLRLNFQSQEDFDRTIADYRRRSTFRTEVDVQYGDKLVSMWTCAYYTEGGRMFIICKAVQVVG